MSTRTVFRNAGLLVGAQALGAPMALLVNAVAARKLGAGDFGLLYQAVTFGSFAFLFVEWGQPNVLTAKVAAQRELAGRFLGSALAFRIPAAIVATALVCAVCVAAGYGYRFITILSLSMAGLACATVAGACQEVMRGFERAELAAASYVGWQLMNVVVVVPVLLLGAGINGFLITQLCCALVGSTIVVLMLPRLQVPALEVRAPVVKQLFLSGGPFLIFSIVLLLQPLVDAAMLSKFASAGDLGWYAAARKLVGVAIYPASALILALYPRLCRLRIESMDSYRNTMAEALYAVAILVIPLAVGFGFFPQLGVAIFGQSGYGPAADDLRLLAPYIALVYFSMPIGSCLISCERQVAWTVVQFGCVIVSATLDPPLIGWFVQHSGNGGLGVCVAVDISEMLMVAAGLMLLPAGILARVPWSKLAAIAFSGAVMAAVAYFSNGLHMVLRAIAATAAYVLCLQLSGGFNVLNTVALMREIRDH